MHRENIYSRKVTLRSTPAGVVQTSHAVGAPRLPVDNDEIASPKKEQSIFRPTPAGVEQTSHAVGAPRLPVDNNEMTSPK